MEKIKGFHKVMVIANSPDMGSIKQTIKSFVDLYGGWRPAARELGCNYQDLQYWYKSGKKLQKFLDWLEDARVKHGISEEIMWKKVVKKKLSKK